MAAHVSSHPLRITERDVLREEASLDAWFESFQGLDLHIRVLHARDLAPKSGVPDPFCRLLCGHARHRTATQRRTQDPSWGEEYYFSWAELAAGKRHITVEVIDCCFGFWRPDELLGRGWIDLTALAFEPLEVLELDVRLHPPSVRKLQDVKPKQQPKPPKKQQQPPAANKQQAAQTGAAASDAAAAGASALDQHQLVSAPSFQHFLQQQGGGGGPTLASVTEAADSRGSEQQQQVSGDSSQQVKAKGSGSRDQERQLGSVRVALWWAPTRRSHAFGVAERVSFCLLPGEVKVPPVITHTKLGTLYEEPCMVYIKLSLIEVHLGGTWYLEYLRQTVKSSASAAASSQMARHSSNELDSSSSWTGFATGSASSRLLERSDSLEAALAAVSSSGGGSAAALRQRRLRQQQLSRSGGSSPRFASFREQARRPQSSSSGAAEGRHRSTGSWDSGSVFDVFTGGLLAADSDDDEAAADALGLERPLSPAEELRMQQRQQQLAAIHLAAEPVFALARLRYGKQQVAESIPVRLRPGGAAVFLEQFVFAAKRPLQHKHLVLEVVLRGKALPGGKLAARAEWPVVQLLMDSPPPPTTWLGVQALRRNEVPGLLLPLRGIDGSTVELIAAAADADGRAAMYGVPQLGREAAAAAGVPAAATPGLSTPRRGPTPRSSLDGDSWPLAPQQQQRQQPWLARVLTQQVGWRKTGAGAGISSSAPSSPRGSGLSRLSTGTLSQPGSARHATPSPFSTSLAAAATAVASGSSSISGSGSSSSQALGAAAVAAAPAAVVSSAAAGAAAAGPAIASASAAVQAAAAAAAAARGGDADVAQPDAALSPIPSLPIVPEPGGLARPLATLQLVIHRVELVPEPTKGWWVVIKVGPHWARSSIRRESDLSWQLSVPIYHPTTTLVMVVYGEAGRNKVTFIGKLHYRISYLLYLNHQEVVKTLKLRTGASAAAAVPAPPPGAGSSSAAAAAAQAGALDVSGVVLLAFTCAIPDRQRLMAAYERSPYPAAVHQISLFHAAKRDEILMRHHRKVVAWLSTVADPQIPPVVAWKVLESGRESFKLSRSRHNIQRLKAATSWMPACWAYFTELKAWARPWHNLASVWIMACVCFCPRFSMFVFLLWRSVVALRRLLMHSFVEYLGVDLGELFDSAGLLPSDVLYDEGDEDDDAASTTSSSSTGSAWGGGDGGGGAAGGGGGWASTGGGGGGGGVRDLAATMMFQPRRLQRLKRRYEQLLRISLQVQNRIDDIAMAFERLHAMVTGQDPLATALFFWRGLLLATGLWVAGPGPLIFAWWCWEVLRPPSWRKPPGIKGLLAFVTNLPSRSLEEG